MDIRESIRMLAGKKPSSIIAAQVDSVNKTDRTIDCTPLNDEAPLLGINLQAGQEGKKGGIVIFPKEGSYVVVGMYDGLDAGCLLLSEEIEEVELKIGDTSLQITDGEILINEGSLGGMVKVKELTKKLNALEQDLNQLKQVFSKWEAIPNDGGKSLKGAISSWAGQNLPETQQGDIENTKVKH